VIALPCGKNARAGRRVLMAHTTVAGETAAPS
jgi:hypothetical protein